MLEDRRNSTDIDTCRLYDDSEMKLFHLYIHTGIGQVYVFSLWLVPSYLGDAQLAGSQLLLVLVHLLVALGLGALQLLAAFHHGLHFWLHLTDVEASHCELLLDHATAALVLLEGQKRKSWRGTTTWRKKWGEEMPGMQTDIVPDNYHGLSLGLKLSIYF